MNPELSIKLLRLCENECKDKNPSPFRCWVVLNEFLIFYASKHLPLFAKRNLNEIFKLREPVMNEIIASGLRMVTDEADLKPVVQLTMNYVAQ